ncbi:MAG: PAS domain S-box protein [Gemmatimonadetes bacterium]|nr:PAS domain S-box protein [Gemmatimonadota bacterium]NNF14359.1 PAS domain S-box protein [Gemmatimonadota bacterium]NNL29705.1 PAS domain S-box protein [Gemmatimonadota bacterium]
MDIRTKLVFTFVAVALASMFALAYTAYQTVAAQLTEARITQLEGLAAFKVGSLQSIVDGWSDLLSLVATRDRIRTTLADYSRSSEAADSVQLRELLDNVRRASPTFHEVSLLDPTGNRIVRSGPEPGHPAVELDLLDRFDDSQPWYIGMVFPDGGEMPLGSMAAPIDLAGERLGYLHALLTLDEIVQISQNTEGLGRTGETMVVVMDGDVGRIIHPVRAAPVEGDSTFDRRRYEGSGLRVGPNDVAAQSLQETELSFQGIVTDYRGQEVWAATSYLRETDWGVLVKVDAAEQMEPIREVRDQLIRIGMILAAFAIVAAFVISFRVAQPILKLSAAADRIHEGDLSARSGVQREDEVGLLARTFDEMAEGLEEQVRLLTEYHQFFNMSLDMMCIAATDGYFKQVNEAWTRELGWSEEELLSKPFVSFVHPDDVQKTIDEVAKLDQGIPTVQFDNRYLHKDGTYRALRWRSTPEGGTGRLYAIARIQPAESPKAEGGVS